MRRVHPYACVIVAYLRCASSSCLALQIVSCGAGALVFMIRCLQTLEHLLHWRTTYSHGYSFKVCIVHILQGFHSWLCQTKELRASYCRSGMCFRPLKFGHTANLLPSSSPKCTPFSPTMRLLHVIRTPNWRMQFYDSLSQFQEFQEAKRKADQKKAVSCMSDPRLATFEI